MRNGHPDNLDYIYCVEIRTGEAWIPCYVGQTLNPRKRWNSHKWQGLVGPKQPHKGFLLHRAMHAHGLENFRFTVVLAVAEAQADVYEQLLIRFFRTLRGERRYAYNLDKGGRHNRGCFSVESRRRMSKAQKERWTDPASRSKWSRSIRALHAEQPEIASRMSSSRKAFLAAHPEIALKHSAHLKAINAANPDLAQKHSAEIQQIWRSEGFREKMVRAQKASYAQNPSRAQNHARRIASKWQEEGYRSRLSAAQSARYKDPEERHRTGAACQRSSPVRNRSGYKGVSQHGAGWSARIKYDGQSRYIGTFPTPELAATAYNDAALELFGPGAFQNRISN